MCLDCGCKKPNDDHGNADHITMDKLQRAARASNIDMETAADRIHDEARRLRDSGQVR
jgi:hypothetical protein